jgi:transglutaminase-like putative cysteine protease
MLFHIKHTTRYSYSRTVFCEPFLLRLRPREDASQRLVRFQRSIHPQPAGINDLLDVEGNTASHCWFNGPTCLLTVTVNSVVETLRSNAFDFLLENSAMELPVRYRPETCPALMPYRTVQQPSEVVQELADRIKTEVNQNTVQFLVQLASWICENFEKTVRPEGDPFPAEMTLQARQGSCRDLAVLFAEACRSVGLAARFVSGYQAQPEADGERHLHAWTEIFLPGAGWRGFDPGQGLAVSDQHVAVATGLNALAAAPTVGTFRGDGTNSSLETLVVIRVT